MAVEDIGAGRLSGVDPPDRYRDRLGLASSINLMGAAPAAHPHKATRHLGGERRSRTFS